MPTTGSSRLPAPSSVIVFDPFLFQPVEVVAPCLGVFSIYFFPTVQNQAAHGDLSLHEGDSFYIRDTLKLPHVPDDLESDQLSEPPTNEEDYDGNPEGGGPEG